MARHKADPTSRLPDGTPYYGRLGEISYDRDEDKVQCHLCGTWLHQVGGSHLLRKHDWTIEEYRRAFRIPKRIPTCGEGVSDKHRQHTLQRIAPGGDLADTAGRFERDPGSARTGGRNAASNRVGVSARKPFLTHRPLLRADWHPDRNPGISPNTLGVKSSMVVWWRCSACGHEWEATVKSRASSGSGCPHCFRENARRHAEVTNQRRIRELAPHRSITVTNPSVAAELHPTRNPNVDPELLLAGSNKTVWWLCSTCGHEWHAQASNRARGGGCPACSGMHTPSDRSLAAQRPTLLAEWHSTLNGELDPSRLGPGSGKTVWWLCSTCGHTWQARIEQRAKRGAGCPDCRRTRGLLAATHPRLIDQLHPTRNPGLDLATLRQWSHQPLWWICPKGHEWQASPRSRARAGSSCPACSRRGSAASETDALGAPRL